MGATANTGRKVIELLLEAGEEVRALGRSAEKLADLDVLGGEGSARPRRSPTPSSTCSPTRPPS
jgi:uncharacterized protein YbjT (DUF2867 family)